MSLNMEKNLFSPKAENGLEERPENWAEFGAEKGDSVEKNKENNDFSLLDRIRDSRLGPLAQAMILSSGLLMAAEKIEAQTTAENDLNSRAKIELKQNSENGPEQAKDSLIKVIEKIYNINKNSFKILEGSDEDRGMPGYYFADIKTPHMHGDAPVLGSDGKIETHTYSLEFVKNPKSGQVKWGGIDYVNNEGTTERLIFNETFGGEFKFLKFNFKKTKGLEKMSVKEFEEKTQNLMCSVKPAEKSKTPIWVDDKFNAQEVAALLDDLKYLFDGYNQDGTVTKNDIPNLNK